MYVVCCRSCSLGSVQWLRLRDRVVNLIGILEFPRFRSLLSLCSYGPIGKCWGSRSSTSTRKSQYRTHQNLCWDNPPLKDTVPLFSIRFPLVYGALVATGILCCNDTDAAGDTTESAGRKCNLALESLFGYRWTAGGSFRPHCIGRMVMGVIEVPLHSRSCKTRLTVRCFQ